MNVVSVDFIAYFIFCDCKAIMRSLSARFLFHILCILFPVLMGHGSKTWNIWCSSLEANSPSISRAASLYLDVKILFIPPSVRFIDARAFMSCSSLVSVHLDVVLPSGDSARRSFQNRVSFLQLRFPRVSDALTILHSKDVFVLVKSNSSCLHSVGVFGPQHLLIAPCSNQSLSLHQSNSSIAMVLIHQRMISLSL
jgi:hypothetical protein